MTKNFKLSTLMVAVSLALAACGGGYNHNHTVPADNGVNTETGDTGDNNSQTDEERKKAEEEARLKAEEEARLKAEEEARLKAEEEARLKAEEEARLKAEEEARLKAEEEARLKAEEEARLKAEEEARLKAEEEARLKAEEEARLKAEEEARLKAEEEARLKAEEEARAKVGAYTMTRESTTSGSEEAFKHLEYTDFFTGETVGLSDIYKADGSGKTSQGLATSGTLMEGGKITTYDMSYESYAYNQNHSAYGLTYGDGRINGLSVNEVLSVYAGEPTIASKNLLTGSATYNGAAYIADSAGILGSFNNKEGNFELTADFDQSTVSGAITWQDDMSYDINQKIELTQASITNENDHMNFAGVATRYEKLSNTGGFIRSEGTYDGKFMGPDAAEVVGKTKLDVVESQGLWGSQTTQAAFGGKKQ